ncbi:MAG: hypothetical protein ABI890_15785, partial [Lapillicoccus sp.]
EGGVVAGQDVHAWVEVRTQAGRWLPILPQEFVPARDRQPAPQQQRSTPPSAPTGPAATAPPEATTPPVAAAPSAPAVPVAGGGRTSVVDVVLVTLAAALTLVLLAVLGIVGRAVAGVVRRRRRLTAGSPAARVAAGWSEVVTTATGLGLAIPRGLTRVEQGRVLQQLAGPVGVTGAAEGAGTREGGGGDLVALAGRADALLFAADPPGEAAAASFGAATTAVRSRLRGQASFSGRLSAALDLPDLRHRLRRSRFRGDPSPAPPPPHDGTKTPRGGPA